MLTIKNSLRAGTGLISDARQRTESHVAKLSSGNRIQNASDDTVAMSVSTRMLSQTISNRAKLQNVAQIESMTQVAAGALFNVQEAAQRLLSISSMASSDGVTDTERSFLQLEFSELSNEIDRLIEQTNFNGKTLLIGLVETIKSEAGLAFNTAVADKAEATLLWSSNPTNNQNIRLQNTIFVFRTTPTPGNPLHVRIGASVEQTLENLKTALRNYNVNDRFKGYDYIRSANYFIIRSQTGGYDVREFSIEEQASSSNGRFDVIIGQRHNNSGQGYYTLQQPPASQALAGRSVSVVGSVNSPYITPQSQVSATTVFQVANPATGLNNNQRIRIDNGLTGFVDFTFRNVANPLNPQDIQRGASNEETLENAVRVLNNFKNNTGVAATNVMKFAMQKLEFERDGLSIIVRHLGTGPALDARFGAIAVAETTTSGSFTSATLAGGVDSGINTQGVMNPDFYGKISGFKATYNSPNNIQLRLNVGEATYVADIANTTMAAPSNRVYFSSEKHGFFSVLFNAGLGPSIQNQQQADIFAENMNDAFSSLTMYQTRDISDYRPYEILQGTRLTFTAEDFTEPLFIDNISVLSAADNDGRAKIAITINDETFEWQDKYDGTIEAYEKVVLVSQKNPNRQLTLVQGDKTISLESTGDAAQVQEILTNALPKKPDAKPVSTKGTIPQDATAFELNSFSPADLLRNQALAINTRDRAQQTFEAMRGFIREVTDRQAVLGAIQSRLGYMREAIINNTSQLVDATAVYRDTDIAAETTAYASAQAVYNAGISANASMQARLRDILRLFDGLRNDS